MKLIKEYRLFFVFLATMLYACNSAVDSDSAVVTGIVKNAAGETLKFEELKPDRLVPHDSLILDDQGVFSFITSPAQKGFYLLRTGSDQPISLVLDKGDSVQIDMDVMHRNQGYRLKGNNDSRILRDFNIETAILQSKVDSLKLVLLESRHLDSFYLVDERIENELRRLMDDYRNFTESLIKSNTSSLASILLINQSFAGQLLFKMENYPGLFLEIDKDLNSRLPQNPHVMAHHKRVNKFLAQQAQLEKAEMRVSPGSLVPEISLPGVDGKQRSLEDLRGNFVVLFFWATWSPESRADIQQLKKLYKSYHPEGLEVYAISMDHKEKFWEAVIGLEKMPWVNVSDLAGVEGPVGELFRLDGKLPYYFLLDKKGIILQKTPDFSVLEKEVSLIFK